jgi:hypothetical protein
MSAQNSAPNFSKKVSKLFSVRSRPTHSRRLRCSAQEILRAHCARKRPNPFALNPQILLKSPKQAGPALIIATSRD